MERRTWKVYGRDGHRQAVSFQPSYEQDFHLGSYKRDVSLSVKNADVTGTNEFTIVTIEASTRELCEEELWAQIYDGAFENVRVGKVEEVIG